MSQPTFIDLTGRKLGRLLVIDRAPKSSTGAVRWNCICDCGTKTIVHSQAIRTNHTTSCGCARRGAPPTHGKSRTAEYLIWRGILARCYNPNVKIFYLYGGRGICVCDAWKSDFPKFLADMGPRPSLAHSVERDDSEGHYSPGNCRWATPQEQVNNRRCTRFVEYQGKRMALTDAVRAAGSVIHYQAAWNRIERSGWTVERALETPRTMESPTSKSRRDRLSDAEATSA